MKQISQLLYISPAVLLLNICAMVKANEFHVSVTGDDSNSGTASSPFRNISAAVARAFPGDTITVHHGIYRERINPLRGGKNDSMRILYRAAPGEKVEIKGSEVIRGWKEMGKGVWKVVIPDSFFGDYHPFRDSVHGDWFNPLGRTHHTGDVFLNGSSLFEMETLQKVYEPPADKETEDPASRIHTWYCENNHENTTIWANFQNCDPNKELVEITVRNTCFYPEKKGINYLTISGFCFNQAATQWAAPTAHQVGMVATHWNKGWIIENNVISDSRCSGITLGKDRSTGHNVWSNDAGNINRDGNIHYIEVIFRALRNNWNKEHIGSHIVRNNIIFNCEQAGICGSMGAVFSKIENNHIYQIHTKRQFKGWEIAGIKIHAPVDVLVKNNRIHDCERGIWLDWMTQGARVTGNLLYRNRAQDIFIEVSHGPYIVDNNILLSRVALSNWSQGGAYLHNLFVGIIETQTVSDRFTPYFLPHSTEIAGLTTIFGGDDRFCSNIFCWENDQNNIAIYDSTRYPSHVFDNFYANGVRPPVMDEKKAVARNENLKAALSESGNKVHLKLNGLSPKQGQRHAVITSETLGRTSVSRSSFMNPDGSEIRFDRDYFGNEHRSGNGFIGPFAFQGLQITEDITVWPRPRQTSFGHKDEKGQ